MHRFLDYAAIVTIGLGPIVLFLALCMMGY